MLPKERVIASILHEEPDRVPTAEIGLPLVDRFLGNKNSEALRKPGEIQVELIKKLGWDVVVVYLSIDKGMSIETPVQVGDILWRDSSGNMIRYLETTGRYFYVDPSPQLISEKRKQYL